MASESAERQQLEDLKAAEKERAEADVFATFERLNAQQQQAQAQAAAAAATAASGPAAVESSQALAASSATSNATIWEDSEVDTDSDTDDDAAADTIVGTNSSTTAATAVATVAAAAAAVDADASEDSSASDTAAVLNSGAVELQQEEEEVRYTPAPRHGATVALGFTARLFPTPCRESKAAEEEAWIMKNRRVTLLQNVLKMLLYCKHCEYKPYQQFEVG
jgi:hypothetical protein